MTAGRGARLGYAGLNGEDGVLACVEIFSGSFGAKATAHLKHHLKELNAGLWKHHHNLRLQSSTL
jgi:hypothetical protein